MSTKQRRRRRVSFSVPEQPEGSDVQLDESENQQSVSNASSSGDNLKAGNQTPPTATFDDFSLDTRVEKAIRRVGWQRPTPVQTAVIPNATAGKDLLVCAPTGSGKTAAYGIPLAQYLCQTESNNKGARAFVLAPTRELVAQVASVLKSLCRYIDGVRVSTVLGSMRYNKSKRKKKDGTAGQPSGFNSTADVLVGTPASLSDLCARTDGKDVENVGIVVVDEADLVLSLGNAKDARRILSMLPSSVQTMLLSATLDSSGMQGFTKVMLREPLTVKVTGESADGSDRPAGISHLFAKLNTQRDRFLVTYAMLRLKVLTGKILIFVNHINAAFRLKLLLDQFHVKTVVLNSELPLNSRLHCVEQFNSGSFNILIATDELTRDDVEKKVGKGQRDGEYGVTRGVDFKTVSAVINFDVAESATTYTHRAGRTARAGLSGQVLTLVVSDEDQAKIDKIASTLDVAITGLEFRMNQIEAFRYRVEDCLRMVTDAAVNSARVADVQREIVNSTKLKDYFEENPDDYTALQHDLALARNVQAHLAHVPSYLLPPGLRDNTREPNSELTRLRKGGSKAKPKKKRMKAQDPLANSKRRKR